MTESRKIQVKPSKKQFKALMILLKDNWVSFLWYGWAAWWWKTILAALWISMMCKKYPWVKYWVFRRYITDVLDTTFQSFTKALLILWFKEASTIDELMKNPWKYDYVVRNWWKEIVFSNNSEILFRWLQDKPTDVHFTKIWWLELTWAYIDEANECPEMWVSVLKKRVWRHLNNEYKIPRKVLCTFNPDKWWIYRTFYIPYKNNTETEETMFIPALPTDNPYLTQEYLDELKNEKNEVLRQRYYYWNFDYDDTPWRLFDYNKILELQNNNPIYWEKFITCDPAREWRDSTIIMLWNWLTIEKVIQEDKSNLRELKEYIRTLALREWVKISHIIVDENWLWWWLVDELWCQWFINNAKQIEPKIITNQVSQLRKPNYDMLKTQCYHILSQYVNEWKIKYNWDSNIFSKLVEELDIIVQVDIDKDGKFKIISKEDIKEKLWRSPDISDCMMFRMFYEIRKPIDLWWVQSIEEIIHHNAYEIKEEAVEFEIELNPY